MDAGADEEDALDGVSGGGGGGWDGHCGWEGGRECWRGIKCKGVEVFIRGGSVESLLGQVPDLP